MSTFFFAIGALGIFALYKAMGDTSKVRTALVKASNRTHFHKLLGMMIIIAHASEIGRVVSHISLLHLVLAIFLFALWLATRYESEEELA
ncbi:MAG: hypothetical protein M3Q64_00940 [bacterium]|nr:hypothetical protein [bacterium]